MQRAEVTLPGRTSSVPTARRFVDSLLTSWGHPDLAWTAALCVSELAGNCALHARTQFTVRLQLEEDLVRIEVSDGSPRVPSQRAYTAESTTGRGLRLVDDFSRAWGVEAAAGGKTVWVLLDVRPAPPGAAEDDEEGGDVDLDALLSAFGDADGSPGDASGAGRVSSARDGALPAAA